jgi:hypothetical protein
MPPMTLAVARSPMVLDASFAVDVISGAVLDVGGALATFDGELRRAAQAEGVELLV